MQVKFIKKFVYANQRHNIGDVAEVKEKHAKVFIAAKLAVAASAAVPASKEAVTSKTVKPAASTAAKPKKGEYQRRDMKAKRG